MPEYEDEEALRWDGEEAPSVRLARQSAEHAVHQHEVESTTETDEILDLDEDDELRVTSASTLVTTGVLAGIYFLYTLGWLTYALRTTMIKTSGLDITMFNIGLWLAVIAAPLWFGVTFWFVQRASIRYAVLVLGALVLIPIPVVWPS